MQLTDRLKKSSNILDKHLNLISQWDQNVLEHFEQRIENSWLEEISTYDEQKLFEFDGLRNYKLLENDAWLSLVGEIQEISTFEEVKVGDQKISVLGNKKKQHELNCLHSLLHTDKDKQLSSVDFGGGVGNLSYFLENELNMTPLVLERNLDLIETGKKKLSRLSSSVRFQACEVDEFTKVKDIDFAIGLHTCGNFANDMLKTCVNNKVEKIVNFGCCYSKIENDDYHMSSLASVNLHFNQRALGCATLSFGVTSKEFYQFRMKIIEFKYSFYNWLYQTYGIIKFCKMGNSRRTLYNLSFYEFVTKTMVNYFPEVALPTETELKLFFKSEQNKNMIKYLKSYYAISRYIGQTLENYILCDRALYVQEQGYKTEIKNVFDHQVSPRNKGIIATLI